MLMHHGTREYQGARGGGGSRYIHHNKLAQGALFRHHLSSQTAGLVCVLQIPSWFFFFCVCVHVCTLCGVTIGIGEKGSVALLGVPRLYIWVGDVVHIDGAQ